MIRAIQYLDKEKWLQDQTPGSFFLSNPDSETEIGFWYFCPCGCAIKSRLAIGRDHKPELKCPSWSWSGPAGAITLSPSVNHVGHWHGWLRQGYWVAA